MKEKSRLLADVAKLQKMNTNLARGKNILEAKVRLRMHTAAQDTLQIEKREWDVNEYSLPHTMVYGPITCLHMRQFVNTLEVVVDHSNLKCLSL